MIKAVMLAAMSAAVAAPGAALAQPAPQRAAPNTPALHTLPACPSGAQRVVAASSEGNDVGFQPRPAPRTSGSAAAGGNAASQTGSQAGQQPGTMSISGIRGYSKTVLGLAPDGTNCRLTIPAD